MLSFTVLINCYNYERYVETAIRSALDLDYPREHVQVLVVDDGSTDSSGLIARTFSPLVEYHYQSNRGQAAALNTGFRLAMGDIVCLLDADDTFHRGKLQVLSEVYGSSPTIGAVYNRYNLVDEAGGELESGIPKRLRVEGLRRRVVLWRCAGVPTSSISMRREVMSQIRIPEEEFRICADSFLLCILPLVTEIGATERSLTSYRRHTSNGYLSQDSNVQRRMLLRNYPLIGEIASREYGVEFFVAPFRLQRAIEEKRWGDVPSDIEAGVTFLFRQRGLVSLRIRGLLKLAYVLALGCAALLRKTRVSVQSGARQLL